MKKRTMKKVKKDYTNLDKELIKVREVAPTVFEWISIGSCLYGDFGVDGIFVNCEECVTCIAYKMSGEGQ
jgi:hypothetical protein